MDHTCDYEKQFHDELQNESRLDKLTGLLNRKALDEKIDEAIKRFEVYGEPFCLLFADLDNFKNVNDVHGHLAGDDMLRELTQRVAQTLRDEGADSEGGWHSWRCFDRERYPEPCDCTEQVTRAALAAAEPHIRAKIAAEIEAMDLSDQYGPLTAHGARADAARIARQEQP